MLYAIIQLGILALLKVAWSISHNYFAISISATLLGLLIVGGAYGLWISFKTRLSKIYDQVNWHLIIDVVVGLLILTIVEIIVAKVFGTTPSSNQMALNSMFRHKQYNSVFVVSLAVLIAPAVEETLCRWLPNVFLENSTLAFVLGVVSFALLHVPNNVQAWIVYSTMAIILGSIYLRDGIRGSWIMHITINVMALLAMMVVV